MKPVLTALAGAVIAASLAANACAQPQSGDPNHRATNTHNAPTVYSQPPRLPPLPQPRPPNSLGADWRLQQNEVRQGVTGGHFLPLAQVIGQLAQREGGRELDAGLETQGGRPIYRIRWMTRDGRRVDLLVDATTGAILSGG